MPRPGQVRDGNWLVGMGVAAAIRGNFLREAEAKVTMESERHAVVEMDMTDIGTGSYTVFAQIAAEVLDLPVENIKVKLGHSSYPDTPGSGGSFGASSCGAALHDACTKLKARLAKGEGAQGLSATGSVKPGDEYKKYSQYAYGAHFAEVGVDRTTGEVRLRRMLGVFAAGRILNPKTAHSQLIGGMIWGVGSALEEEAVVDPRIGAFVTQDLVHYHVPVHADVPQVEAVLLDEFDKHANVLGSKGVGELGICGAGAAVANAVYNACGARVRDYPITLDKVLPALTRRQGLSSSGPSASAGHEPLRPAQRGYLPMQKSRKMMSNSSSMRTVPVMRPSARMRQPHILRRQGDFRRRERARQRRLTLDQRFAMARACQRRRAALLHQRRGGPLDAGQKFRQAVARQRRYRDDIGGVDRRTIDLVHDHDVARVVPALRARDQFVALATASRPSHRAPARADRRWRRAPGRGARLPARWHRPSSRRPAVSASTTGQPPRSRWTSMTSRVVPAVSDTMAASRRASRLSSEDLPALGGPMMAMCRPSRRRSPRRSSRWAAISACSRVMPAWTSSAMPAGRSSSGKSMAASRWASVRRPSVRQSS